MAPLAISIITPTYNAARTLPDTLRALADQAYPNLEYIIVDGGSTDGTLDIVRASPLVTRWVSEPDRGIYDAMNKGIRMAAGDIVGIINGDDYFLDRALHRVAAAAEADAGAGCFYGDQLYERLDGATVLMKQRHPIAVTDFWRMPVNTSSVFVRPWVYQRHGGFDTAYRVSADCEMFLRFTAAGVRWALVDGPPLARTRAGGFSDRKYFLAHVERVRMLRAQRAPAATLLRAVNRLARYPVMSLRTGRAFRGWRRT